uniref:tRNA (guanine(9)-N(1))-methyltransferase n=1 Tax=Plectus sambesii TaxID=2011161 RepID=A0A914V718_9BILA
MSDSPPPTGCDDSDNNEEQDESGSEGASDTQDNGEASSVQGGLPLSKRQMKKQQKKQWLREQRKGKRKLERERRKEKRRIARENGEDLSADAPSRKKLREQTMASSSCRIRIAVDMSFDHLMSERDLRKSLSQLNFCYATNRRCANPVQFFVTNFNGPSRK